MADFTMASSAGSPGASRSAKPTSCDMCRKRKSKCGMERPFCVSCLTHNWPCSYSLVRRKPGPRQGSRQSQTIRVQQRLDRIESLLPHSPPMASAHMREIPRASQSDRNLDRQVSSAGSPRSAAVSRSISSSRGVQQLKLSMSWIENRQPPFPDKPSNSTRLSPPLSTGISASQDLCLPPQVELELISLFFSRISLPVPVFCAAKFYLDYEAGRIPRYLLDAIFSLSARFSHAPEVVGLASGNVYLLGKSFAQKANRELDAVTGNVVSPTELKAAYLLTYHDLTYLPSRGGAQQCAKLARMAYMCRLHQLDNASIPLSTPSTTTTTNTSDNNDSQASVLEREENRCLWWAIFALDSFSSLISFIPFSIEDSSTATCLPSSIITDVALTDLPQLMGVRLDDESFWPTFQTQLLRGIGAQSLLLYVVRLSREITIARRWYYENTRCNLGEKLESIRKTWESLLTNVPSWYFNPMRHELDKSTSQHRKRLECLNMISILGSLSSFPPLQLNLRLPLDSRSRQATSSPENAWKICVSHAITISKGYQSWTPEHFLTADPSILPITWMATCILIIETMNSSLVKSTERLDTLNAVDTLMCSLNSCSQSWGIVAILMRSVVELRGQSWRKLDLSAIHQLLLTLSAPQNQDGQDQLGRRSTDSPCEASEPVLGYSCVTNAEAMNDMLSAEPMLDDPALPLGSDWVTVLDWLVEQPGNGLWQNLQFPGAEQSI